MGIVAWVVGGSTAMYAIALGFASEVARFPGGARAMGTSLRAAAQALRLLRWPPERLDTLGGYLTYHNLTLFALFLSLYAAIQGARAVRGLEARRSLEEILATGWTRSAVIRDRTAGFVVALTLITLGMGLGLGASMAAAGEPDLGGSMITVVAAGLCALAAYAVGLLVSQVVAGARAAPGISALIVTGLYVFTNVWDQTGPLSVVRFASPFFYFNSSRVLVPGHGLDLLSMVALLAMAMLGLVLATWAFERRDYASGLWKRSARRPARPTAPAQRPWLKALWTAVLVREWPALLAWGAAASFFMGLVAWLEPAAIDVWEKMDFLRTIVGRDASISASAQYMSFAAELIAPIIAAFVVVQAAGWVADLREGRVEAILAAPVSWSRLVWERLAALLVALTAITAAALGGLAVGASAAGAELSSQGLIGLGADSMLLGAGLGAVAAIAVAWLRDRRAVIAFCVFVAASYLVSFLVPLYDWPNWVARLSVFGAFGRPYLKMPPLEGLVYLGGLAALGAVAAAAVASRTPKIA